MKRDKHIGELPIDFDGADAIKAGEICQFKKFAKRRFLIGYCRHDKRAWIMGHHLYNVRINDIQRLGNVNPDDPNTYAVDYVILYENSHSCSLFTETNNVDYLFASHAYILCEMVKWMYKYLMEHPSVEENKSEWIKFTPGNK